MKWIPITIYLFITPPVLAGNFTPDTAINGISLNFTFTESIFPDTWLVTPINGKGESLAREEVKRSTTVLIKTLKKYPDAVLKANLTAVYVLKSIKFYDVGYGGTNSTAVVYITNNGVSMGYTDEYVEQTFHHEFSSILYRNFPKLFDQAGWERANIPGFDYNDPESGVGAIRKNESSQDLDTALCSKGFLTQYALSGMENDINTVAQNLFKPAPGFWTIVDNFQRINRKTKLLIDFYYKINPAFNEEFFRQQAR